MLEDLFVFQLFSPLSEESENKREEDEEEKLLFKRFTPAGPVYAFLANLYSRLADVGRRFLCTVLFPAFLCLSAPPLSTCSLAIVCLCRGLAACLASGEPGRRVGQNAKRHWLPGRSSNMKRWFILETVDTDVRIPNIYSSIHPYQTTKFCTMTKLKSIQLWRKSPFTTSLCFLSIRPIENWKIGSSATPDTALWGCRHTVSRANHLSITFEKMFIRKCCLLERLMVDECKRCTCCATVYRYNQSVAPAKPWGGTSAFNFEMTQAPKNAKHYSTCWNAAHFPFFQFPVTRQRTNLLCLSSNFSATPLLRLPVIRFKAHHGGEGCEIICGCNYGLPSLE